MGGIRNEAQVKSVSNEICLAVEEDTNREQKCSVGKVRDNSPTHNATTTSSERVLKSTSERRDEFAKTEQFSDLSGTFRSESLRLQRRLQRRAALRRQVE